MPTTTPSIEQPVRPAPPSDRRPGRAVPAALAALVIIGLLAVVAVLLLGDRDAPPEPAAPGGDDTVLPEILYGQELPGSWDVSGIDADAVLRVHEGPGGHTAVLASLEGDAAGLEGTGRIAWVDDVAWRELRLPGDGTGWVEVSFLVPSRTVAGEPSPPAQVRYGQEPPARWDVTGIAAGDTLNVRAGPGTSAAVVATLERDVTGLASTGRIARVDGALWRELRIPGTGSGWVSARYLTAASTPPAPQPGPSVRYGQEPRANWDVTGVAAGDVLNVRSGPGTRNAVIATLAPDVAELESTGRIARVGGSLWREIIVPGDGAGWVNARHLTETAPPPDLPAAVAATARAIERAAAARDWDALAALALAEPTPFTATYGEDFTTPADLAAFWRDLAADEPLADIAVGLVRLPDWFAVPASDGQGGEQLMHVTPRFHHDQTAANRRALEQAIGADRVAASMAGGQYLGWRIGITADGDWRFFVSGD